VSVFDPKPMPSSLAGKVNSFSSMEFLRQMTRSLETSSPDLYRDVLENFLSILKKRGLDRVDIEFAKDSFKTANHIAKMYRRRHEVALRLIANATDLGGLEGTNSMLAEAIEPIFQKWWTLAGERPDEFKSSGFYRAILLLYSEPQVSWIILQLAKYPLAFVADDSRRDSVARMIAEMERSIVCPEQDPLREKLTVALYRFDQVVVDLSRSIDSTDFSVLTRDGVARYAWMVVDRDRMVAFSRICWDYINRGYIGMAMCEEISRSLRYTDLDPSGNYYGSAMVGFESSVFHKILQPTLLTSPSGSGAIGTSPYPALALGTVLGAAAYRLASR